MERWGWRGLGLRAAAACLGCAAWLAAAVIWYGSQDALPQGVTVSGWKAEGLKADEFAAELTRRVEQLLEKEVRLSVPNAPTRTASLASLGIAANAERLAAEAVRLTEGNVWERALRRWQWRGRTLTLALDVEPEALDAAAKRLWPEMYAKQPVNARRIILAGDRIVYTPEAPARRVDAHALRAALLSALDAADRGEEQVAGAEAGASAGAGLDGPDADGRPDAAAPQPLSGALRPDGPLLSGAPLSLNVPIMLIQPEVTVEMLKAQGIERVIASYSTSFAGSGAGRKHNIAKTASVVHDRLLAPGDIFDYAKIIEETERIYGFREAPVILNGKMVPGIGGGICQVSTTLYNAVLLAGLEIVERRNHSLPVSYAPLGRDATFVDGYINFKFRNSTGKHLLIRTSTANGVLTVKLFGSLDPAVTYDIQTVTLQTIKPGKKYVHNPGLPAGSVELLQRGKPGYVVETYRVKKVNGKTVSKERISRDTYQPQPALYAANSGKARSSERVPPQRKPIIEDGVRGPSFR